MAKIEWDSGLNEETPVFDDVKMSSTMRDCLCAQCWGPLTCSPLHSGQWFVYCKNCGEYAGFVTKKYVERRKQQDCIDYIDVYYMLTTMHLLPEEEPTKSDERILEELGF
jgi:hypothetical protein